MSLHKKTNGKFAADQRHAFRMALFLSTSNNQSGFSIIELVVVVGVLATLAGISVPAFLDVLADNNVDEVKALLNTAAAECLQKNRTGDGTDQKIDDSIISNAKLNNLGYNINQDYNTCAYLELQPIDKKDPTRFPLGFSVTNGILIKSASVSENNKSDSSCKNWAGTNCKSSLELKEFARYNKSIKDAEIACGKKYENWWKSNPTGCAIGTRWDASANSQCPTRPPKQVKSTCTPNGCNIKVWAFEGNQYSSDNACKLALDAKWKKLCDQWKDGQKLAKTTNSRSTPKTYQYCGAEQFWFCDGIDLGDAKSLNKCIDDKAEDDAKDFCLRGIADAKRDGHEGEWPTEEFTNEVNNEFKENIDYATSLGNSSDTFLMPEECTRTKWICKGRELLDLNSFNSCMNPPVAPGQPNAPGNGFTPRPNPSNPGGAFSPTQPTQPSTPGGLDCNTLPPFMRRAMGC